MLRCGLSWPRWTGWALILVRWRVGLACLCGRSAITPLVSRGGN